MNLKLASTVHWYSTLRNTEIALSFTGGVENLVPMNITLLAVAFVVLLCVSWIVLARTEKSGEEVKDTTQTDSRATGWLAAVTLASACLCVVQLYLGYAASSLTLLADVGHSASDVLTFALAYFVEVAKVRFGRVTVTVGFVMWVDCASACFSVLIISFSTIVAMVEAWERLSSNVETGNGVRKSLALVFFSLLTLFTGLVMLFLKFTDAEQTDPSMCQTTCCAQSGALDMLHGVVHPGGCRECLTEVREQVDENLNVYGVLLHLGADVLRTLVMLITGIAGFTVARGVEHLDSIASLVVGGCVLIGSLGLLFVTVRKVLRGAWTW
jgi:Co/Zn/Cd efflux system component